MKMTVEEFFFFAFFVLLSVTKGLGLYEGQKLFLLLVFPALICGLVKIVITPYTKRQWIMQILLLLMTAVVYYESRELGIFFVAFLVLGMKNISVEKVFHVGLRVWAVCAAVLSIFSFYRLEHTVYRVHDKLRLGHIFRWSLGFTHPNILHITYLALCAFILYELGESYKFRHFIYLMLGNLLVFLYSVSYTGFAITAVLLAGCLYVKLRPKFWVFEKLAVNLVLPLCLTLSFVLPLALFAPRVTYWIQQLNFMLNTRIYLARQFLTPEYISLFGKDVSKMSLYYAVTMDNSYVWGFIHYGIIPFAVIILGYFVLTAYDTHKQKTRELVIIVCFFVAGWTEQLLFNTSFKNITLIFLGELLYMQKEGAPEYCLFPKGQRQVEIPFAALPQRLLERMGMILRMRKKAVAMSAFAGAIAGIVLCGLFYGEPAGYVVQRFYTDGAAPMETVVYLEKEDDPEYTGYRVMNYVDGDTPMQVIDGKAVRLETVRYYIGSMCIGGFAGALACIAGCMVTRSRRAANRNG